MKQFSDKAEARTWSRLAIGGHYATALWNNGRREPAVRILETVVGEFRAAHDGVLPSSANGYVSQLGSYREAGGEFAAAEKMWLSELGLDHPEEQKQWLTQQLYQHYVRALSARAEVSLGKGEALYRAVHAKLLAELGRRADEGQMVGLVNILSQLWHEAHHNLKYGSVREDVRRFAFEQLAGVLALYQYRQGQNAVSNVVQRVAEVLGPRAAVEFLVDRAEKEPAWLRLQDADFWNQLGWYAARYREEAKGLEPATEERLLAIVLRELEDDLRMRHGRNRSIYHDDYSYYWAARRGDFSRVAREVLETVRRSEPGVLYVAQYLFDGLSQHGDAIDALARAHGAGLLSVGGRHLLCSYLQQTGRWGESVPLLVKLVEDRPGTLEFRLMLMRGCFHTGDGGRLAATRSAAEAHFKEAKQWHEHVIAPLGVTCVETRLFREAAAYLEEAIALHVKASPNRGVGDGQLSHYYGRLAAAYGGLGMTDKAVDAASGAIVCWSRSQNQRQQALAQLEQVLAAAADRDAYVARLDAQVKETGQ
jgi:tetratricopeptide (TPR) repeat protein